MNDPSAMTRQVLYGLKRQYPARFDIYVMGDQTSDARTGRRTVSKTVYPVERGVALPAKMDRAEKRSISQISANKGLVMGAFYDTTARRFIVDRDDVSEIAELTEDDWLVFNNRKYQIVNIQEFEDDAAWMITARALLGETPEQIFLVNADNMVNLNDQAQSLPADVHLQGAESLLSLDSEVTDAG